MGITSKQMEREVIVYASVRRQSTHTRRDHAQNPAHAARDPVTCKETVPYRQ